MDPYNTADEKTITIPRNLHSEYDANRELLASARTPEEAKYFQVNHIRIRRIRGRGTMVRGIVGVILWGLILLAVTGATAILMGY